MPWLLMSPGPTFIKPDQFDPWIKDQLGNALLSTILALQLQNFALCGRACPSHMTQNLVTVRMKLLTGVIFIWSLIHGSSWSGLIKVGPGHQQLWYWLCRIGRLLLFEEGFQLPASYQCGEMTQNVNMFMLPQKNLARKGLMLSLLGVRRAWTSSFAPSTRTRVVPSTQPWWTSSLVTVACRQVRKLLVLVLLSLLMLI